MRACAWTGEGFGRLTSPLPSASTPNFSLSLSLSLSLSSSKSTRSFDEIYTLLVKDCEIKLSTTKREPKSAGQVNPQQSTETLKADMVKLICQDAKIGGHRA